MKKLVVLMAVSMLLVFAVACCAQYGYYDEEMPAKQNAIKLGIFRPQDGDVRDAVGKSWFMAAYERTIRPYKGGDLTVEVGYTKKNGDVDGRVIPLTLNYRVSAGAGAMEEGSMGGQVYYGAGLGAYLVKYSVPGDSVSKTKFGGNVFVGFGDKDWLLELKYHLVSSFDVDGGSVKPGGFALMAGYKF